VGLGSSCTCSVYTEKHFEMEISQGRALSHSTPLLTTSQRPRQPTTSTKPPESSYSKASYYAIEPLPNFNLTTTQPLKLRPFKPKFHMTMALENTTLSDLIPMDNTYLARCALRTTLIQTERYEVLACNLVAVPAVLELYTWLTGTYLPTRFPSLYTLTDTHLQNHTTGAVLPLQLPKDVQGAEHALALLGSNIDDEFLILLPTSSPSTSSLIYNLGAFINCFPSGFNTRSKLNKSLSDIHGPVPGYAEKYVSLFFLSPLPLPSIPPTNTHQTRKINGSLLRRPARRKNSQARKLEYKHHWPALPARGEPHDARRGPRSSRGRETYRSGKDGSAVRETDAASLARHRGVGVCIQGACGRVVCLGRCHYINGPQTYQYPIKELRDEGSGEMLAEAIDGLRLGSVPGIAVYKRQVVWGEKVKAFLRGEIDA
jgi:hypothetical protein